MRAVVTSVHRSFAITRRNDIAQAIINFINSSPRTPSPEAIVAILEVHKALSAPDAARDTHRTARAADATRPQYSSDTEAIVAPVAKAYEPPHRLSKAERAAIGAEMAATIARTVPPARPGDLPERILATIDARDAAYAKANAVALSAADGIDEMKLDFKLDEALCQGDAAVRAAGGNPITCERHRRRRRPRSMRCSAVVRRVYADPDVVQLIWAALEVGGIQDLPQFARLK